MNPLLKILLEKAAAFSPGMKQLGQNLPGALTEPRLSDSDHPIMTRAQGFGAGAAGGFANLLAQISHPTSAAASYLLKR